MNQVFWIGVYPGLTSPMLDFVASILSEFVKGVQSDGRDLPIAGISQIR
jgi:hypothetical protein